MDRGGYVSYYKTNAKRLLDELREGPLLRRGGTRKIADFPDICRHPEHGPAMHRVYTNGLYEHVCPGCGFVTVFTVRNPTL